MKQENLKFYGTVQEELGNSMFKVRLNMSGSPEVICTISGKIRKNHIRVMAGDSVQLEISPYDLTRGRIIYRQAPKKKEENDD